MVDCPGFHQNLDDREKQAQDICKFLMENESGFNLVLLCIPCTDTKLDQKMLETFKVIKILLGDKFFERVQVIYTMLNSVENYVEEMPKFAERYETIFRLQFKNFIGLDIHTKEELLYLEYDKDCPG